MRSGIKPVAGVFFVHENNSGQSKRTLIINFKTRYTISLYKYVYVERKNSRLKIEFLRV